MTATAMAASSAPAAALASLPALNAEELGELDAALRWRLEDLEAVVAGGGRFAGEARAAWAVATSLRTAVLEALEAANRMDRARAEEQADITGEDLASD